MSPRAKKPKSIRRPASILYGLYDLHQSFCFADEARIRAFSDEVDQVKACTTVREAMELAPKLGLTCVPGVPENEEELEDYDLTLNDAHGWTDTGPVQEGDWPPMPTGFSLEVFDSEDREAWELIFSDDVGAKSFTTTLNGDYLHIPPENEQAMLAAFTTLGIPYVRDDRVLENLSECPDALKPQRSVPASAAWLRQPDLDDGYFANLLLGRRSHLQETRDHKDGPRAATTRPLRST